MILTFILIDLIFLMVFKFPLYIISLIFIFYKNNKLILPIIFAVSLDIFMSKILLSLIVVVLSIIVTKINKKLNLIKSLILLSVIYLGIHLYIGQLNIYFLFKLVLLIGIYLLVLKLSLMKYKLIR